MVFYSGHGIPVLKSRTGYLLPVDADPDLLAHQVVWAAAYSAAWAWQLALFSSDGRSRHGLVSKNPAGISLKPQVTQGCTGKSSGRGW